jgi:hypothetical protein
VAGLDALVGGAFAEICEAVWETTYRGAGCDGRDGDFEGEAANGEIMPHSIWITIAIFNAVMFSIAAPLLFTALAIVK